MTENDSGIGGSKRIRMEPSEVSAVRFAEEKAFEFGPRPEKDDPRYLEWIARKIRREDGILLDSMRPAAQIDLDKVTERDFENPPTPKSATISIRRVCSTA
jgi:hypothetical protein